MTDTLATDYIVAQEHVITADVSADIGNARAVVLVRPDGSDVPIAVTMPAVRSLHGVTSWELFAARGLPSGAWGKLKSDEHIISRDEIERFVGRLAVERARAASSGRGSDARYYDGTTLDFLLAGVAAALPSATKIAIRLTTVIPISLWHIAPRVEQATVGTHKFSYNGRDVTVLIRSATIRREAEAAYPALDGDVSGKVLIIDIGGRTVNLALFTAGEYRGGKTLELGVEAALDSVDTQLQAQGAARLTLAERGELINALVDNKPYVVAGQRIGTIARAQFVAAARALCQEVSTVAPVDKADRIILIGGGAYPALFGETIKAELPRAERHAIPELANAYGALGVPTKKAKKR